MLFLTHLCFKCILTDSRNTVSLNLGAMHTYKFINFIMLMGFFSSAGEFSPGSSGQPKQHIWFTYSQQSCWWKRNWRQFLFYYWRRGLPTLVEGESGYHVMDHTRRDYQQGTLRWVWTMTCWYKLRRLIFDTLRPELNGQTPNFIEPQICAGGFKDVIWLRMDAKIVDEHKAWQTAA